MSQSSQIQNNLLDDLIEKGFCKLFLPELLDQSKYLAVKITEAKKNGYPVDCFIHDAFWQLSYVLHPYLQEILGSSYVRLPDFWAWHIDPSIKETGWSAHRDRGGITISDGRPDVVTVWIPLSHASKENSCINVIPKSKDVNYNSHEYLIEYDINDALSLEVNPGEVLIWTQAIIHWGSVPLNPTASPRLSVAYEFATKNSKYRENTLEPSYIPSTIEKLELIAQQKSQYEHMYG